MGYFLIHQFVMHHRLDKVIQGCKIQLVCYHNDIAIRIGSPDPDVGYVGFINKSYL